MSKIIKYSWFLVFIFLLGSCNKSNADCSEAIDYIPMVKFNDVEYQLSYEATEKGNKPNIEKGKEVGQVTKRLADSCGDTEFKNGYSTYLKKNTKLYSVKGYPENLIISADQKTYVVTDNANAKKAKDLYPLDGLLNSIYIMHDQGPTEKEKIIPFSLSSITQFIDSWNKLSIKDKVQLEKENAFKGDSLVVLFELKNGVKFTLPYYLKSNTFQNGIVADESISKIIKAENAKKNE